MTFSELPPAIRALKRVRGPVHIVITTPDDPIFVKVPKSSVREWWTRGWCEAYDLTLEEAEFGGWVADIQGRV